MTKKMFDFQFKFISFFRLSTLQNFLIFLLCSCSDNSDQPNLINQENNKIETNFSTVRVKNLEVMTEDAGKLQNRDYTPMKWEEAKQCVKNFGNGWRLPTIGELEIIYTELHKKGVGNFQNGWYWSSNEYFGSVYNNGIWSKTKEDAYSFDFSSGNNNYGKKDDREHNVRAVRIFVNSEKEQTILKIGKYEIISDLGEMSYDDARFACEKLGKDWRLPTCEEFRKIISSNHSEMNITANNFWTNDIGMFKSDEGKNDVNIFNLDKGWCMVTSPTGLSNLIAIRNR